MSQSAFWSMGTITFEGKIPASDREDTYLGGMGGIVNSFIRSIVAIRSSLI